MILVATSGGFDPVHLGHLKLFREAKKLGDKLVVIVNDDGWLQRKKGRVFMPLEDRIEIIKEFRCVDLVVVWDDGSENTSGALEILRPQIFANGGDRKNKNDIPEAKICEEIGCKIIFNVGGGKIRSSSELSQKYYSKSGKTNS